MIQVHLLPAKLLRFSCQNFLFCQEGSARVASYTGSESIDNESPTSGESKPGNRALG